MLFVVLATVRGSSFTAIKAGLDFFSTVLSLGSLAVVGSAFGYLLYFDLLARLGPIEVDLVSYASSVVAAVTDPSSSARPRRSTPRSASHWS